MESRLGKTQARKKSTKIKHLGPETADGMGWFSLGFEGYEPGMCRDLCRDVWDPKKCSKINSVHTRCIVKTGGFTRGVCKNRGFY